MKSQWTIGKKLTVSCCTMLALILALGIMSLNSISSLNSELSQATHDAAKRLQLAALIDIAGSDMLAGQRGIVLYTYAKDPANVQGSKALFQSSAERWQKALDEFRPLIVREEGRRLVDQLQQELTEWRSVITELEEAASKGQIDVALNLARLKGLPIYETNARDAIRLREIQNEILAEQRAKGESIASFSFWCAGGILAITLLAGAVLLVVVFKSSHTLRRTAAELSDSSEQVAGAANQIASSSQTLAQGASEQAASLEETSASTEEIWAMTRKNADDARVAAELMNDASQVITEANHTLEQMEASMREINESSEKIAKIIKVIDEIAFQTNILSLNAAVEAARAGEAGLGFAVVAEEVRSLAHRSAQAAKDTANIIEESITRSKEGGFKLDQVSQAIRGITEKANAVKVLVDNLRVSSGEQARGAEQITKAVTQVEHVTQSAAASAEETASAGEQLTSQSAALRTLVGRLEELVGVSA